MADYDDDDDVKKQRAPIGEKNILTYLYWQDCTCTCNCAHNRYNRYLHARYLLCGTSATVDCGGSA